MQSYFYIGVDMTNFSHYLPSNWLLTSSSSSIISFSNLILHILLKFGHPPRKHIMVLINSQIAIKSTTMTILLFHNSDISSDIHLINIKLILFLLDLGLNTPYLYPYSLTYLLWKLNSIAFHIPSSLFFSLVSTISHSLPLMSINQ